MAALHIRDMDDSILLALKQRAAANHRSLTGEVKAILEQALQEAPEAAEPTTAPRRPLRLHTVAVGGEGSWSRDEIYDDDAR